jgi:putative endonuclease
MPYVYILRSKRDGRHYIGSTIDLERRLVWHNEGRVKSTRHRRPLEVVYCEKLDTILQAHRRELKLKSLKGGDIIKKLIRDYSKRE